MDIDLRSLQRSGDKAAWLRSKIRSGQLSESMKKMLCALGYEPMVLVLDLPPKVSPKQISFMAPKTYCNYKKGRWLLGIDYVRVAKFICKKHWSREMSSKVLAALLPPKPSSAQDYQNLVDEIATKGFGGVIHIEQGDGGQYHLIDGQARLAAMSTAPRHYTMVLAQLLREERTRDALITAILNRLT